MFWFEDEVQSLENKIVTDKVDTIKVLLYGSSSIRLWDSAQNDFPSFSIVNQAFGGSTLAACCWFFERLIPKHKPDAIVIYAGDNDLGDGRHPEEVFFFYKILMEKIKAQIGDIPVAFISIKPSVARQHLYQSIEYTNKIIKKDIEENYPHCTWVDIFESMQENGYAKANYFSEDGLHLNSSGYALWKEKLNFYFMDSLLSTTDWKKQRDKKRA